MNKPFSLDVIEVRTPCPASWDAMDGDDRVRFCGACRLNVYDLSAMTRAEAETLVREHEGRLCVRLHRRTDGKIVTRDCETLRQRAARVVRRPVLVVLGLVGAIGLLGGCDRVRDWPIVRSVLPQPAAPVAGEMVAPPMMGRPATPTHEAPVMMGDLDIEE